MPPPVTGAGAAPDTATVEADDAGLRIGRRYTRHGDPAAHRDWRRLRNSGRAGSGEPDYQSCACRTQQRGRHPDEMSHRNPYVSSVFRPPHTR